MFIRQADRLLKPSYFTRKNKKIDDDDNNEEEEDKEDIQTAEKWLEAFERHEINLNCTNFKMANYEIMIDGLGWISVQGVGFATFILHLPAGVTFRVRDDPIRAHIL